MNSNFEPAARQAGVFLASEPQLDPLLEAALEYGSNGWRVFPCAGKVPAARGGGGCKDATTDRGAICAFWSAHPRSNIGVATGRGSGVWALDVDGPEGEKSLAELVAQYGPLPATVEQRTGRGRHLYFRCEGDAPVRNSAGKLAPKLDVRGEGGYAIVAPSVHPDTGTQYAWVEGRAPGDVAFVSAPDWLLALIGGQPELPTPRGSQDQVAESLADDDGMTPRARAALQAEVGAVIATPEGQRNERLNRAAFNLGQLAGDGEIARPVVERALAGAGAGCGLEEAETRRTINSGVASGMANPRSRRAAPPAMAAWGEPQPLPRELPPVPRMTPDMLPKVLREWLGDAAERMCLPLDFFAAAALVMIAGVVGRQVGICPKRQDDWVVVPNLWGGLVARPGAGKSPAIAEVFQPLNELVRQARKQRAEAINRRLLEKRPLEDEIKSLGKEIVEVRTKRRKSPSPDVEARLGELENARADAKAKLAEIDPPERRYIVNDPTTEKLGELLAASDQGLILVRDELAAFIAAMGKSGREGDREFYLECWNGDASITVDRIGRGTVHIKKATLSIFGGIQPGKALELIQGAVRGGCGDDGFLQRFQVVMYPDDDALPEFHHAERPPDHAARARVDAAVKFLASLDAGALGAFMTRGGIPAVRFSTASRDDTGEDAQELFDVWYANLQGRLRSGELRDVPALESHISKYAKLMPSLALLFHLLQVAEGTAKQPNRVSAANVRLAIAMCAYLEAHARKLYAVAIEPENAAAHALAKKIAEFRLVDRMSVRDVCRAKWRGLTTSDEVDAGLRRLEELDWVRIEVDHSDRGRPSILVRLNPTVEPRRRAA